MLHQKTLKDQIKQAGEDLLKQVPQVRESEPEVRTYEITLYSIAIHTILSEIATFALPSPEALHHPGLNYVEAGSSLLRGGQQLMDDETHRPLVTKVKGFSNIASGIGLIVITGVGTTLGAAAAAALSAQGMAAALGVAFVISCDEVIRAARRMEDPAYWLSDSLKQWDKLNEKTIPKLQEEIYRLEKTPWVRQRNSAATWALERKKERLLQLTTYANELKEDIQNRTRTNVDCWNYYYQKYYTDPSHPLSEKAKELIGAEPDFKNPKRHEYENNIKAKCATDLRKSLDISLLTGITFAGMLLLCIPGAQPAGALLIGISAAILAVKLANKVAENAPTIKKTVDNFFNNKPKTSSERSTIEIELPTTRKI